VANSALFPPTARFCPDRCRALCIPASPELVLAGLHKAMHIWGQNPTYDGAKLDYLCLAMGGGPSFL
jgi:hypothetical protein